MALDLGTVVGLASMAFNRYVNLGKNAKTAENSSKEAPTELSRELIQEALLEAMHLPFSKK